MRSISKQGKIPAEKKASPRARPPRGVAANMHEPVSMSTAATRVPEREAIDVEAARVMGMLLHDKETLESLKRAEEQARKGESRPWREVDREIRG